MISIRFGTQLQTLPQIFEGHLFTVPDYQRGYAWDEKQVCEMLVDIDHLLDDGATRCHYTGTLVFGRPQTGRQEYHVVDGQQRLTTLVILLSVLVEVLPQGEQEAFRVLYLRRGALGSDRAVLQLNSDTRLFFERVILGDGDTKNEEMPLEAHERLLQARLIISAWLNNKLSTISSVELLRQTIENRLGFLVYAPKADSETGIMFEVINNRGKPLSELEKVKNYLIYCCAKLNASTLRSELDKDWSTILTHLSCAKKTTPADEGAFLRYCMAVHFKLSKTDSQNGYDELKKRLLIDTATRDRVKREEVIQAITVFVRFMLSAALWHARLYGRHHAGMGKDLAPVLDQIRAQDRHASIMPLFLALVVKQDADSVRLPPLLELLEVMNFRVYMTRNMMARNDSGQGDLYWYAANYYHGHLLANVAEDANSRFKVVLRSQEDALEYCLVKFTLHNASDARLKESLALEKSSNDDFYAWSGLRYFLMNYEQRLQPNKTILIDKIRLSRAEGKSADYLSVEHFWAQEYRSDQGENDREVDKHERRRLGNFVLLELRVNIQGGKQSVAEKVARYVKGSPDDPPSDLHQVRLLANDAKAVLRNRSADKRSKNHYLKIFQQINDRQELRFTRFAIDRWSVSANYGFKEISKVFSKELRDDDD